MRRQEPRLISSAGRQGSNNCDSLTDIGGTASTYVYCGLRFGKQDNMESSKILINTKHFLIGNRW